MYTVPEMLALEAQRTSTPFFQRDSLSDLKQTVETRNADPVGTGLYADVASNLPINRAIQTAKALISGSGTSGTKMIADKFQEALQTMANNSGVSSSNGFYGTVSSGVHSAEQPREALDIADAPITSAVSGITDPEARANAYSEMMANSAHQREVADLMAAGLNPVLSAKYGGSPSASAASDGGSSGSSGGSNGSVKKTGFQLPVIHNPRTPMQILYNVVAQNSDLVVSGAKALASAFAGK